jgi:hypothetical protein
LNGKCTGTPRSSTVVGLDEDDESELPAAKPSDDDEPDVSFRRAVDERFIAFISTCSLLINGRQRDERRRDTVHR